MKKGFTLIELLAVIVILAIIALIATPIILGIINDAREESNERSVELYASAVRNAVAAYQLTGTTAPETFSDLSIQYDGNVVCATEELYEDGSFYIAGCTVNGKEVDYTYGKQQEQSGEENNKPKYYFYSWSAMNIGDDLPNTAKENPAGIDTYGYPYYFGVNVDGSNKITEAYACFIKNETEYCLKGGDEGAAYNANIVIIKEAFADVVDAEFDEVDGPRGRCEQGDDSYSCYDNYSAVAGVTTSSNGDVSIAAGNGSMSITSNGTFSCDEV